ncbi:MAG: glycosyltransferase family 2 protein [Acidimicrobiales bacterium]
MERGWPAVADGSGSTPSGALRPRFSVVIPALDEELCLPACLRSLARQDFDGEVEVIVVDNNSTDQTAAVARSHGAVVVHEPRPGVCWARQRGTEVARGDVVVSTDADTTFDPGWLTGIDRVLREHPSYVAVGGPCAFTADSPFWAKVYPHALFGTVAFVHRITGRVFYVTATNLAFRREAWPGYDTQMTQGGDEVDLLRRLRRRGPVHFDRHNPTFTSARRLQRGLAYNLVVTFFVYYLLAYWLNRMAGRPLIGTAPAFRRQHRSSSPVLWACRLVLASTVFLLGALLLRTGVYVAGLVW